MVRGLRSSWRVIASLSSFMLAGALGCSSSEPPVVCLEAGVVPASCTPAFEPSWDAIYANSFQGGCTLSGVSCHASTGKQAGVDLSDVEVGYATVKPKVRAGDPACSILVQRVMSTSGKTRMPPGRSLPEGELCAITQWVANGAPR